ncbi:MAG TPA: VanZ family protein [Bacilli bacterium]|nr:VanZ family protein [Bacilli bacterium]
MNKNVKTITTDILVLLCMFMIFSFSSMTSSSSNGDSKSIIKTSITDGINLANNINLIHRTISASSVDTLVANLNAPLRKCMHALEYMILAMLIFLLLHYLKVNNKLIICLAIGLCFLYSCTDEYHQTFIDGRTGQFKDCLIDTTGAIIGTITCNIYINKHTGKVSV